MKNPIVWAAGPAFLLIGWWVWGYSHFLIHGDTRAVPLGGNWRTLIHVYAADGGSEDLERVHGGHPFKVDELIGLARYMGDDCVLYVTHRGTSGPACFAVCGDREPLQVTSASYDEWEVLPDGLQKIEFVGDSKKPTVKIPWAEIKPKALAQPRWSPPERRDS